MAAGTRSIPFGWRCVRAQCGRRDGSEGGPGRSSTVFCLQRRCLPLSSQSRRHRRFCRTVARCRLSRGPLAITRTSGGGKARGQGRGSVGRRSRGHVSQPGLIDDDGVGVAGGTGKSCRVSAWASRCCWWSEEVCWDDGPYKSRTLSHIGGGTGVGSGGGVVLIESPAILIWEIRGSDGGR